MERLDLERIQDLREAAEIHRLVRHDIQRVVQPGMSMVEICEYVSIPVSYCSLRYTRCRVGLFDTPCVR